MLYRHGGSVDLQYLPFPVKAVVYSPSLTPEDYGKIKEEKGRLVVLYELLPKKRRIISSVLSV